MWLAATDWRRVLIAVGMYFSPRHRRFSILSASMYVQQQWHNVRQHADSIILYITWYRRKPSRSETFEFFTQIISEESAYVAAAGAKRSAAQLLVYVCVMEGSSYREEEEEAPSSGADILCAQGKRGP